MPKCLEKQGELMQVDVLQATTSYYYHAVPSELERVTISPEERAIFEYLSRIGSDRFVEFITDVLVHVEKHTLVDKADGSGDEKQDILTLDPYQTLIEPSPGYRRHAAVT